ncbi:hypothetical protein PVAP13_2NG636942 [Panicum virgatum]|uniref:Uncharacterized protein n=1 Tax=Panicum virgatum TaxID=38727 RepID=A0A8T0VV39_PANVG|nr:hypothetical protein PVAP13_2NG636942 [Panicum virgatum]
MAVDVHCSSPGDRRRPGGACLPPRSRVGAGGRRWRGLAARVPLLLMPPKLLPLLILELDDHADTIVSACHLFLHFLIQKLARIWIPWPFGGSREMLFVFGDNT